MTVKEHYDTHLGSVYSWMLGIFAKKMSEQMDFFLNHGILPSGNHLAFDLGAGNGIQSVALAKLGFKVTAVDFSKQLLEELLANKQTLPINCLERDIVSFLNETSDKPELIICMGDTLTHFRHYDEVQEVIRKVSNLLTNRGKIVLSYRDLSVERKGADRFFQVKSEDARTLSCFLEYFDHHAMVHDLILEKSNGLWTQKVSCYPKLRIPVSVLKKTLQENHITILQEEAIGGLVCLTGQVP